VELPAAATATKVCISYLRPRRFLTDLPQAKVVTARAVATAASRAAASGKDLKKVYLLTSRPELRWSGWHWFLIFCQFGHISPTDRCLAVLYNGQLSTLLYER